MSTDSAGREALRDARLLEPGLLGEPGFEHRAREANVATKTKAGYPTGPDGLIEPAGPDGEQARSLLGT
jgi:hypothetical protein